MNIIINNFIEQIVVIGNNILFFNVLFWQNNIKLPFLILWLSASTILFSFLFAGKNFRLILTSAKLLWSKKLQYQQNIDIKNDKIRQETSKNIVMMTIGSCIDIGTMFGVVLMIKTFGVGSIFWVLVSGLLATSVRLSEIFMGHYYRIISPDYKSYIGGPQIYIKQFFAEKGWVLFGKILANIFIVMLFCSTFASAQLNQTATTLRHFVPILQDYNLLFGFVLASIIITIVSGGFHRIIMIASNTVSIMSKIYFVVATIVVIKNYHNIVPVFYAIFTEAFSFKAGFGGFLSMVIFAFQRGFFCNEAGMGSGAISHSNSINKNSMQEAVIGMITPILTTSILCMTSGLMVAITDAYLYGETGLDIMVYALNTVHPNFHYILLILIPSIGISAATAWAYYGQRAFASLFGEKKIFIYNMMLFLSYLVCITATNFSTILNLADIANLGITIPNIIALFFASNFIAKAVKNYKT